MINEQVVADWIRTEPGREALKAAMGRPLHWGDAEWEEYNNRPETVAKRAAIRADVQARFEASGYTREQLRNNPDLIREVFGPRPRS